MVVVFFTRFHRGMVEKGIAHTYRSMVESEVILTSVADLNRRWNNLSQCLSQIKREILTTANILKLYLNH